MPRGDGTGPSGQGAGTGRGMGGSKQGGGRGRMSGNKAGAGPSGYCRCPSCGKTVPHTRGAPCYNTKCPACGQPMTRQ